MSLRVYIKREKVTEDLLVWITPRGNVCSEEWSSPEGDRPSRAFLAFPGTPWELRDDGRPYAWSLSPSEARKVCCELGRKDMLSGVSEKVEVPRGLIPQSAIDSDSNAGRVVSCVKLRSGVVLEPDMSYLKGKDSVQMVACASNLRTLSSVLKKYGIRSCLHTVEAVVESPSTVPTNPDASPTGD